MRKRRRTLPTGGGSSQPPPRPSSALGAPPKWPPWCGYARAKEYLLTGAQLGAQEAERIGLINRVVPDAQLDATVQELAQRLATGALKAIKWTKLATNLPLKKLAHEIFDAAVAYEMLSNRTQDHREAIAAFRERRKPVFVGR